MTKPVKPDDPRLGLVVDLLLGHADGLTTEQISAKLDTGYWIVRRLMHHLRQAERAVPVPAGNSTVLWATPANAAKLARRLRAASKVNAREQQRRRRGSAKRSEPPAKLYDQPDFDPDDVADLPVTRRIHTCWPPLRVAPGPTSIFDLANHA